VNSHERLLHEEQIEKSYPQRPHWQIIDSDEGVIFAKKEMLDGSIKNLDILEGIDDEEKSKYKSIIFYETGNEDGKVMVRSKREPLIPEEIIFREPKIDIKKSKTWFDKVNYRNERKMVFKND